MPYWHIVLALAQFEHVGEFKLQRTFLSYDGVSVVNELGRRAFMHTLTSPAGFTHDPKPEYYFGQS